MKTPGWMDDACRYSPLYVNREAISLLNGVTLEIEEVHRQIVLYL
jgi:hypothetical protein